MPDEIKDMIANIASGNMAAAKDQVNDMLSQRIVAGMDAKKVDIAKNLFTAPEPGAITIEPEPAAS